MGVPRLDEDLDLEDEDTESLQAMTTVRTGGTGTNDFQILDDLPTSCPNCK